FWRPSRCRAWASLLCKKDVLRAGERSGLRKKDGIGAGLAGAAAPGAEALDLPSLGRRHVVRTPAHLAHEPLLLHLAPKFPQSLLELLGILDYDSHDPTSLQAQPQPTGSGSITLPARRVGRSR